MKVFGLFAALSMLAIGSAELKRLKIPFYEMKPGETIMFRGRQVTRK